MSKIVGLANSPSKPSIITTKDNTHTIISKIFIDDDRGTCYIINDKGGDEVALISCPCDF